MKDYKELIERLNFEREEYLAHAKQRSIEGHTVEYWEGKASGLLLAIEIIKREF